MQVEKINESKDEIRVRVTATPEEMQKAFSDGLDAFVTQYQLDGVEGETALEKIATALGEEDAQSAVYTGVINYLVPFALEEYGVMPLSTYGIASNDIPGPRKPFSFEMTILAKPDFELTSYDPVEVTVGSMPEVKDEDLEEQMRMLAREFAAAQQSKDPNDETLVIPAVTDTWVAENLQPMGVSNVEELRQRFRAASEDELMSRYEQAKMSAALEEYAKRFEGEISEVMLKAMVQELFETFQRELASDGIDFESFAKQQGMTEEDVRANLAAQAENQLKQGFILDAIFRHHDLKLETSDLMIAVRNIAPGREDETFDAMQKTGRTFLLKEGAARMKAANWILENTTFNIEE